MVILTLHFFNIIILCLSYCANGNETQDATPGKNMVYEFVTNFGPINYAAESNLINSQCREDLKRLNEEAKKLSPWALKMLDASGKPASGILNGNLHALGSINQCVNIGFDNPCAKDKANVKVTNVTGMFCIATIYVEPNEHILSNVTVKLMFDRVFSYHAIRSSYHKHEHGFMLSTSSISRGLCLPGSCNHQDVFHLLEYSLEDYNASGIVTRVRIDDQSCYRKQDLDQLASSKKFNTLFPIFFFIGLAIIATMIDSIHQDHIGVSTAGQVKSAPKTFLLAFSLRRTWPQLWDTSFYPDEITSFHGIRFIGILIVYVQHKVIFRLFNMISNRTDMIIAASEKGSSPFRSMYLGTDIFVFLSGALTAYYTIQQLAKRGRLNLKQMYISRYIKFTPTVMAVSWFTRNMYANLSAQYFRIGHFFSLACRDNSRFWLNLFHVQNFLGLGEICCPHTHSLATDMQHSLVAPFVIMLLWKLRNSRWSISVLSIFSLLLLTLYKGYIVYINGLATNAYFGLSVDERRQIANTFNTSPVQQFTTYLLGLLFGAFIRMAKPIILNRRQKALGWLLFLVCMYYTCFRLSHASLPGYTYEVLENTEYTMVRPIVSNVALGFLIYMCHTGQAESINRLLSWRYFVIFSKLSYAIYLSSVVFIVYFIQVADYSISFSSKLSVIVDLNEIAAILISSIIATLLLIIPLKEIAPLIMGVKSRTGDEERRREEKEECMRNEEEAHKEPVERKTK